MNKKQKNKAQSHKTRFHFLKTAPEVALIKGMPAKLEAYGRKIGKLDTLAIVQSERSRAAAIRDAADHEMREAALTIAGVALSHADEKEIPGLADQVRLIPNDFFQARQQDRVQLAQQLHGVVLPLVPELSDYGVTDETMDDFLAKITRAEAALPLTRVADADKRAATLEIDVAIRGLDEFERNQVFPLLLPLKKSKPETYRRYLIAREVVDRPGTRGAAEDSSEAVTTAAAAQAAAVTPLAASQEAQPKAA